MTSTMEIKRVQTEAQEEKSQIRKKTLNIAIGNQMYRKERTHT